MRNCIINRMINSIKQFLIFVGLIVICVTCIFSLILLLRNLHNSYSPNDIQKALTSIAMNIKSKPLLNLELNNGGTCPYEYELLILDYWPGTLSGCLIDNKTIDPSDCNQFDFTHNLKSIPSQDPKNLSNWKNISFCAKYAEDYYLGSTCKSGYIQCSSGMCYNSTFGCPITNVNITNNNDLSSSNNPNMLKFNNDKNLFVIKRDNDQPSLLALQTSSVSNLCLKTFGNLISDDSYLLLNNVKTVCGPYGDDPTVSVVDIDFEYNFYMYNFMKTRIDSLPFYESMISSKSIYFVQRSRYGYKNNSINQKCFAINSEDLISNIESLLEMTYFQDIGVFMLTFFHFNQLITGICAINAAYSRKNLNSAFSTFGYLGFFSFPDYIMFGLLHKIYSKMSTVTNDLIQIGGYNCFSNDIINQIFLDYAEYDAFLMRQNSYFEFLCSISASYFFLFIVLSAIRKFYSQ